MDDTGSILLLGRNSFLARATLAVAGERFRAVSHPALDDPGLLDGIRSAVVFARHPLIQSDDYDLERDDPDVALARRIGDREVRYLMLSTRKVYAPAGRPLDETAPTGPTDAYGRNKLAVERRLRDLLGERLVILRLANIFGFELEAGRRTFLAMLLRSLRETGRIRFDMSPFVERDFLPAGRAAELIVHLLGAAPGALPPVLNLGSGIPLPTGRLALWVLEGYGRGELVIEQTREHDAFVLDVRRLAGLAGPVIDRAGLERACRDLGRRLAGPLTGR